MPHRPQVTAIPFTNPQPIAYVAFQNHIGTSPKCSFLASALRDSDLERSLEIQASTNPQVTDVGVPEVHLGQHWPNEPDPLIQPLSVHGLCKSC